MTSEWVSNCAGYCGNITCSIIASDISGIDPATQQKDRKIVEQIDNQPKFLLYFYDETYLTDSPIDFKIECSFELDEYKTIKDDETFEVDVTDLVTNTPTLEPNYDSSSPDRVIILERSTDTHLINLDIYFDICTSLCDYEVEAISWIHDGSLITSIEKLEGNEHQINFESLSMSDIGVYDVTI